MPRTEFEIISQPASTSSHLFDEIAGDAGSGASAASAAATQDVRDCFDRKEPTAIAIQGQITGRVPVSSGAFGLIQGVDTGLGSGMRMALFRGLKEIGLGFLEGLYDNAGGNFDLPFGTALALTYKEKTYDPGSRYVKEDEVRKACDEAYRRDGREIIWIETEGVSEIGNGAAGTVPIGTFADASANFKLSGIIRYRRLEPYESASGALLKGQAFSTTLAVPITATLARQMPPGAEFEFTGDGHIQLNPELSKPLGYANPMGKVGASARLGLESSVNGETTMSVQRLPGGDEVLVKIAHGTSANLSFGASLKAGLDLKTREYEKMPELGRGFLKFALERMGLPDVPQFVKRFMQSQLLIKSRTEKRETEIARFVFDLSKPAARRAYEDLFARLSLGKAKDLVAANEGAVRSQRVSEKTTVGENGAAALIGQTKLILLSALFAEREGKVSADGRGDVLFRDIKFEKTWANWFSGEKKIKWETVAVTNTDKVRKQRFYHLAYSNNDRITKEHEIDDFLRFAHAIGVPQNSDKSDGGIDPEAAAKVLANRDDTETRASLYFTDEGIKRIVVATKPQCFNAYLAASNDAPSLSDPRVTQIVERFQQISKMWFFVRVFYLGAISRLRKEYAEIAPGRSLDKDARLVTDAQQFADLLCAPEPDVDKKAEGLFVAFGRASGFDFMRKTAALARLAGVGETILHELSISGGGLTLGAIDEGEILHPERAMRAILTKIV